MSPATSLNKPSIFNLQSLITNYQLLFILAIAAILRLGWVNLTEFKADEARLYLLALDMAEFKSFALRGIGSSVGIPNFPISVWLFSIPLFIWKHPYSATLFVGLLNTVAVYVTYRVAKKYWGESAALVAALMFAVSPWAIIYSRKIWAQDLLPLFVIGYIATALSAFIDQRRWMLTLHFVLLSCIIQLHLSGLAFIPLTLLWLIIFWKKVNWRELALGILGGVIIAIPFGIYALQLPREASNIQSLILNLSSRPSTIDLDSLRYTWMLLIGSDIHSLAGPKAFQDFLNLVPNIDLIRWLWGAMALGGLIVALLRRHDKDVVVASWLIVPALIFTRHSTPVFPHYFILTLPAGYILAGDCLNVILEFFTAKARRTQSEDIKESSRALRLRGLLFGVLILSASLQATLYLALLFFIGSVNTPNGFGTPLGMWLDVVDRAKLFRAQNNAPEILLVGEGDDPAISEFAAVMDVLFHDVPHRFVDGSTAALFPSGGATVVIQPSEIKSRAIYEKFSKAEACLLLRESEQGVEVLSIPKEAQIKLANGFAEPRTLANGVELIGWERDSNWMIAWRVGYVPAASEYHFFNHAASVKVDGVSYPSRYWRDGDVLINFFNLNVKEPVRVGMYEYPSIKNVPVMDVAGNPFADALEVKP